MNQGISILHLEDDPIDAEIVQATLEAAGLIYQITCAQSRLEFEQAIRVGGFDLILADYRLPAYDGTSALRLAREVRPDIPFIFVSGTMGEDAAIDCMTQGATDYVLKQKLSRLVPAIRRALADAENRRERQRAESALQESAEHFRAVAESANEGIISIDIQGNIIYWNQAASTIFGYSQDEILGQPIFMLMADQYRDQLHSRFHLDPEKVQSQTGKVYEAVGRRQDGSEFPAEISVGSWSTRAGHFYTAMVRDITERRRAFEQVTESRRHLQRLSQQLVDVQESERRALALELHDELGQLLNSAKMSLDMIPALPPEAAQDQLHRAQTLVSDLVVRVRQMSLQLRPSMLDDMGLLPALRWLFKNYHLQTGEVVDFVQSNVDQRFPPQVEITAYRIIQEALTNILRHAGNKQVHIEVWADDQSLNIQVADHGVGFIPSEALKKHESSGLSGMRERARLLGGELIIESTPGVGTNLSARLPFSASLADKEGAS